MVVEKFPPLQMNVIAFESAPPVQEWVGVSAGVSGPRPRDLPELNEKLAFSVPQLTPIGPNYQPENDALQAFLTNTPDRWFLAHMALNFLESDGPRLQSAGVKVNLGDDGAHPDTIAFSILPLLATAPPGPLASFTLNPTAFGFSLGSVNWETRAGKAFLTGKGELSSCVTWAFTRRRRQPLNCETRLVMIIKSPKGREGRISIELSASVRTGSLFRRRSRALVKGTAVNDIHKTF
jgi:hypothetical protein